MPTPSTPSRLPTDTATLVELADALSFRNLDAGAQAPFTWPGHVFDAAAHFEFYRIRGMARRKGPTPSCIPSSLLAGLATGAVPIAFVAASDGQEVVLAIGTPPQRAAIVASNVHAVLGGPQPTRLPLRRTQFGLPEFGCLAGVPACACPLESTLDVLLDSLAGASFLLLVYATAEPPGAVRRAIEHLRSAAKDVDRGHLLLPQQSNVDRAALRARELIDAWLSRLEPGLGGSLWRVSVLFGSTSRDNVLHGLNLLSGATRSEGEKAVAPLRGYLCGHGAGGADVHANLLSPGELASLCPLPRRDRVGFALRDEASFDVDHRIQDGVRVGQILDGEVPTGRWFAIDDAALCRHALVAGHTGSGKSTTVKGLLLDLASRGVPFLVIEPAKAEYRALASRVPELCAFAAGAPPQDGQMPFVLNPFVFPAGFPLHTHIDFLKQVFVASFGLVPPTPYLLESAIYRAYESRGWDLVTGRHPNGHDPLSFPTLSALVEQVDAIVDEADYRGEISSNLRAALRTRIGNLCMGPKGLTLDTLRGLPDEMLFGGPVVLELKHLGSDEEKALVMGLVITRLYELRESTSNETAGGGLRHVLVIEEAHRLLKHTPERSSEESNMAHQAIQTFANLLAELRAYGQGVVLVEQLPSKLAPEMVKHAGTKIVHRLTPRDDRDVVGDAMVLTESQNRALAVLPTGEAVAYGEGMDGAVRVRVPMHEDGRPATAELTGRPWRQIERAQGDRLRALIAQTRVATVLARNEVREAAERSWLAAFAGLAVEEHVADLRTEASRFLENESEARDAAVAFALEDALLRRALYHGWSEAVFELVRKTLQGAGPRAAVRCREVAGRRRACSSGCRFCYEGSQLAVDELFRDDVAAAVAKESGSWREMLPRAVVDAVRRRYGWEGPVPDGLLVCGLDQALARAGVSHRAAEKVLGQVFSVYEEAERIGAPIATSPTMRRGGTP